MNTEMNEKRAADELDRLLGGTPPQLDRSPETGELALMVETARRAEHLLAPARLSNAAQARIRVRVMNRTAASAARARRPVRKPYPFFRRYAFALASLLVIAAILGSGVGVVYAAEPSLPGDTFYGVKLGFETTRLVLTLDPQARADYLVELANERVSEIQALVNAGRIGDLGLAYDGYSGVLTQLENQAANEGEAGRLRAIEALQNHIAVLQALQTQVPASALGGLQNAQDKSQHGLEVLYQLEQGLPPNEVAPGQLKKTPSPEDQGQDGGPGNGNGPPQGTPDPGNGNGRPQRTPPGQKPDVPPGQGGAGSPGPPGGQGHGSSGDHPSKGGN